MITFYDVLWNSFSVLYGVLNRCWRFFLFLENRFITWFISVKLMFQVRLRTNLPAPHPVDPRWTWTWAASLSLPSASTDLSPTADADSCASADSATCSKYVTILPSDSKINVTVSHRAFVKAYTLWKMMLWKETPQMKTTEKTLKRGKLAIIKCKICALHNKWDYIPRGGLRFWQCALQCCCASSDSVLRFKRPMFV